MLQASCNASFLSIHKTFCLAPNSHSYFIPLGEWHLKSQLLRLLCDKFEGRTDWDECLEPILNRWLEFVDDYSYIDRVNFNPQCEVLHAICGVSEQAYAAILYSRVLTPSGEFVTHLLAAKVKVVPVEV